MPLQFCFIILPPLDFNHLAAWGQFLKWRKLNKLAILLFAELLTGNIDLKLIHRYLWILPLPFVLLLPQKAAKKFGEPPMEISIPRPVLFYVREEAPLPSYKLMINDNSIEIPLSTKSSLERWTSFVLKIPNQTLKIA